MCSRTDLVSTQVIGLIGVLPRANMAKHHKFMMASGVIDVYQGCSFYTSIGNFCTADVPLPRQLKVGEVAIPPKEIVDINDERF